MVNCVVKFLAIHLNAILLAILYSQDLKNSRWGVDNRIIKICYILLNGNKYKKICIRHSLRNFNNKNKPICESCQNLEKKPQICVMSFWLKNLNEHFQIFSRLHKILHNVSPTIHVTPLVLVKRSVGKKYLHCVYFIKKKFHIWLTQNIRSLKTLMQR